MDINNIKIMFVILIGNVYVMYRSEFIKCKLLQKYLEYFVYCDSAHKKKELIQLYAL